MVLAYSVELDEVWKLPEVLVWFVQPSLNLLSNTARCNSLRASRSLVSRHDNDLLQDSKLVNVFHSNSRVLIVQLPYSSVDEVVGDDFQAYIRDAVQIQCEEVEVVSENKVGWRKSPPPHHQTVVGEAGGSSDLTGGFWAPAEPASAGCGFFSGPQDGNGELWEGDDGLEEVGQLEEMGDGFGERDVVFMEERVREDVIWNTPGVSEGGPWATQGLEDDFELALQLQEEEDREAGARGEGSWDGRGSQPASGLRNGPGFRPGAALLAGLQANGGGLSGENGQPDSGARPLAAINSGPPKRFDERGGPVEEFPSLPSHDRSAFGPTPLDRPMCRPGLARGAKSTNEAKKPYVSDAEDFTGLTKLSRLQGLLVDNLKFDERRAILNHTDKVLQGPVSSGVSADRMKAMMAKSAKDAAKLSHCEQLLRDGPSRDLFSRKSMEKLKTDMVAAGWLNIRHATHLVYRREMPVPDCCGAHAPLVQRVVVACTPSSPHAITRVFHAVFSAEVEMYDTLQEMKHAEDARLEAGRLNAAAKASSEEQEK